MNAQLQINIIYLIVFVTLPSTPDYARVFRIQNSPPSSYSADII
jgi:hypothetical protein